MKKIKDKEKEEDVVKKSNFIKRMTMTGQLTRLIIYISSIVPTIICVILAIFSLIGIIQPLRISSGDGTILIGTPTDFIVIALLVFSGVYGMYEFSRIRRVRKIDTRFPDFIRDLAESRRAGMTFTKAIMYSAKGDYGVLTPEIQKIARQISWGSSVEDALKSFAGRVNTKLIKRTISLIIEASRSGGNVADVLDAATKDARELKLLESERRAGMLSYVAVIYVGMGVFLLIIIVLCKSLLPSMITEGSEGVSSALGKPSSMTLTDVTSLFYYAALVQTGGMGIIAGVFEEGDIISGVKHMFIMILVSWMIFKFLVTGV
ncbi:MAG: type II secretion system F family protein [Thermoplasmatales archaeon]|nr:MAG: type II secretion system F family protein [Thermoplasmatales archaeon]